MTKRSKDMKLYADNKTYEKIDDLQYLAPYNYEINYCDSVELVCSRKIWNAIVCTYAYFDYFKNVSFLYSVVLEPTGLPSLWEKVKYFIYCDIPFGNKYVWLSYHKQRWLVVDFFTNDDFEKYHFASREKDLELIKSGEFTQASESELKQFVLNIGQIESYEDKWIEEEMIRQNKEMKKLYEDS
jgi:hypothetical protein